MMLSRSPAWSTATAWSYLLIGLVAIGSPVLTGCSGGGDQESPDPPVVDITALDYAFEAPDSIRSGWTTLRMRNRGEEHHEFHLFRLPDSRTFEEWNAALTEPVDSLYQLQAAGKIDMATLRKSYVQHVPDWAEPTSLAARGGISSLAPGRTAQVTVRLEPGLYVMDCLLRARNGRTHAGLGMVHAMRVTEEQNGASRPEADLTAQVAGPQLRIADTLTSAAQTIAFEVEKTAAGAGRSYSLSIARLDGGTSVDSIRQWDYMPPAPTEFMGGFQYIDITRTPFLTVDLAPGRYLWSVHYLERGEPPIYKEVVVNGP